MTAQNTTGLLGPTGPGLEWLDLDNIVKETARNKSVLKYSKSFTHGF